MFRRIWGSVLAALLMVVVVGLQPVAGQKENPSPWSSSLVQEGERVESGDEGLGQVRVLGEDESSVRLALRAPQPTFDPVYTTDGSVGWQLRARGAVLGAEGLPVYSIMLGVPPRARVALEVATMSPTRLPLPGPLARVDEFVSPETGKPLRRAYLLTPGVAGPWAQVAGEVVWRGQRVVRVELRPYRFDLTGGRLEYASHLQVAVRFVSPISVQPPVAFQSPILRAEPQDEASNLQSPIFDDNAFEPLFASALANYSTARAWRVSPAPTANTPQPGLPAGRPVYKIEIEADGIYTVGYESLLAAGMDVTGTSPLSLALTWRGQPVAIEDIGDGDNVFEPGEGIRFFGQKFHSNVQDEKYTDTNVYWLSATSAGGPRIATRPADLAGDPPPLTWFTDTVRAEQSREWWARWTDTPQSEDTWFWDFIFTGGIVTESYTISVPFPVQDVYSITVRANAVAREGNYWGFQTHHLRFRFNDVLVADTVWDGRLQGPERQVSGLVDAAFLVGGTNTLHMTILTDTVATSERMFFNWFDVAYRRGFTATGDALWFGITRSGVVTVAGLSLPGASAYDISLPTQTVRVELPASSAVTFEVAPGSYLVLSDAIERTPSCLLRYVPPDLDPPGGADYVIISHASFITQANRLAAFHAAHRLNVTVVDVNDLYNLYNDGVYHPEAIRRFLWHAYDTWARRPSYVLLVGNGNYNFKDYPCDSCSVSAQGEPIFIPPYLTFVDPWQGEVPADNLFVTVTGNDSLPDMMIGRLPALSVADATAMVDKLLGQPGPQYEHSGWRNRMLFVADDPDSGGDFWADSDDGVALVPNIYTKTKIYYGQPPYTSPAVTRLAITRTINAGVTNIVYHGHGSIDRWSHQQLFQTSYVPTLTNMRKLPVAQTYGCLDGFFFYPNRDSVAEAALRLPERGFASHWAAAGLGLAAQHWYLQDGFFKALFQAEANTLGQAAMAGKLRLWGAWGMGAEYIYQTHTVFGDPALSLVPKLAMMQRVTPTELWRPGQVVTYTVALTNTDLWPLTGGILTEVLPVGLVSPHVTWSGAILTPTGGVSYTWQVSDLAYHSPGLVTITAQLDPGWVHPLSALTSTVYLAAQTQSGIPVTASAAARVTLWSDLEIVSVVEPAGALYPGDEVTFTLVFSNAGLFEVQGGVITDVFGAGLTLLGVQASLPFTQVNSLDYPQGGSSRTWQVGDLAPGTRGVFTLTAQLEQVWSDPEPILTNTVVISSLSYEPMLGNNTATITQPVLATVRLSKAIEPTGLGDLLRLGESITYTLVFTNTDFSWPLSGVLTEVLSAGLVSPQVRWSGVTLTPTGGMNYAQGGGSLGWQVAGLAYRSPALVTITGQIDSWWVQPTTVLTNTAYLSVQLQHGVPATVSATVTRTVLLPDLQIAQQVKPAGVLSPGDEVTFTLVFSNLGQSVARGVVVTDVPGVDVTLVFTQASVPITRVRGSPCAWQVGDLAPGAEEMLTLTVRLPGVWRNPAHVLANTVIVGSPVFDPVMANNTATVTRPVLLEVRLIKLVEPGALLHPGQIITYTLRYTNAGGTLVRGVVITDMLPGGLVLVTTTGSLVMPGPTQYVWDVETLAPHQTGAITLVVQLESPWMQPVQALTNTAVIVGQGVRGVVGEQFTRSDRLALPDLRLAQSVEPGDRLRVGRAVTFRLVFSNAGPGLARSVVVTDLLPSGLMTVNVMASLPFTRVGGVDFAWRLGDLQPGAEGMITVVARLPVEWTEPVLSNTASIGYPGYEPEVGDNVSFITLPVVGFELAGLEARAHVDDTKVVVSWETTTELNVLGHYVWRSLEASGGYTRVSEFKPALGIPGIGLSRHYAFTDTVVMSGQGYYYQLEVIFSSGPGELFGPVGAYLGVSLAMVKGAAPTGGWRPGQFVTYTLVFTNLGLWPSANGGLLTDVLPVGLVAPQARWSGATFTPARDFTWLVSDLIYHVPAWLTITAQVDPWWTRPVTVLTNTAYLVVPAPEAMPVTARARVRREVLLPDLQIAQVIEPAGALRPGDEVTFTLTFSNIGASVAREAVVTDVPGVEVTLLDVQASLPVTQAGGMDHLYAWQAGDLAPGAEGRLRLKVRLPQAWPGPVYVLTNTVMIGGAIYEPVMANNTAIITRVITRPTLPDVYTIYLPVVLREE